MKIEEPKQLSAQLDIACYACETRAATHVCRYQVDELAVQVCLCMECMQMDTEHLLKSTIGLQESGPSKRDVLMI